MREVTRGAYLEEDAMSDLGRSECLQGWILADAMLVGMRQGLNSQDRGDGRGNQSEKSERERYQAAEWRLAPQRRRIYFASLSPGRGADYELPLSSRLYSFASHFIMVGETKARQKSRTMTDSATGKPQARSVSRDTMSPACCTPPTRSLSPYPGS